LVNSLINLVSKFNFAGINNISQKKSSSRFAKKISLPIFNIFLFEKIVNFGYRTGLKIGRVNSFNYDTEIRFRRFEEMTPKFISLIRPFL
jgi:hypothetical protein